MFVIWGLNQNADKEWIRGLVRVASDAWVQRWVGSKNTKAAPSSYSSEAEKYEWVDQNQGSFLQRNVLLFSRSQEQPVCSAQDISYFPLQNAFRCALLYLPVNLFVSKVSQQSLSCAHNVWSIDFHISVILFVTKCVVHSFMLPHQSSPNKYLNATQEKRENTFSLFIWSSNLRGYKLF